MIKTVLLLAIIALLFFLFYRRKQQLRAQLPVDREKLKQIRQVTDSLIEDKEAFDHFERANQIIDQMDEIKVKITSKSSSQVRQRLMAQHFSLLNDLSSEVKILGPLIQKMNDKNRKIFFLKVQEYFVYYLKMNRNLSQLSKEQIEEYRIRTTAHQTYTTEYLENITNQSSQVLNDFQEIKSRYPDEEE